MIRPIIISLGLAGTLCVPAIAASAQNDAGQPITVTTGAHWDIAFVRQTTRYLRCPRSGAQGELTLTLDNDRTDGLFYSVSALTIEGAAVDEDTLAQINRGIAEFGEMPEVFLQCAGEARRVALIGEGRAAGGEKIVVLRAGN